MSNKNAMTRLKQQFMDLKTYLGLNYKIFELNGKDEKSSSNERGYTKAVYSDFLRVYNSIDKSYSFSFAFNNPEREDCGGVIVSTKVREGKFHRSYLTFEEFKNKLNVLVKEIKLKNNSSDRLDYETVHALVTGVFNPQLQEINIDDFVTQLLKDVNQPLLEYNAVDNTIKQIKNQINKAKLEKSKEDFKNYEREMREVIGSSGEQIRKIRERFCEIVRFNKNILIKEKPYLSSRLIGHLVSEQINELQMEERLKQALKDELDINISYKEMMEKWSD